MAPTYKLAYGFAGRSSPIEIARRLGLENKVLERAEQLVQGEQLSPEALLSLLERERDGLESEKRRAREAAERMERLADEHERALERLKEEERRFRLSKKSRLEAEVKQVKARLKEIMKTLAREAAAPAVKEAASTIKRIEDELRVPLKPPSGSYGPIGHLRKGDEVIVLPLGSKGILLEEPRSVKGERLRVQVGNIEVRVKEESLGSLAQGNSDAVQQGPNVRIELRHCPPGRISVEKDLRGMTVEEALNSLEKYLDEVLRSSLKEVRIIHGHGSGALKKAVRDFLKNASYVESFRAADPSEGGDGATMVKLA